MKHLKRLGKLTAAILLTLAFISCDNDNETVSEQNIPANTIVELAQSKSELTFFVEALVKYPDLVTLFSEPGLNTVFAPNDAAFDAFLTAIGQNSIDDIPENVLKNVLQYHVITSAGLTADSITNGSRTMANGEDANFTTDASGITVEGSNVILANGTATNGVVHIIDSVIIPPSMAPIVGTILAPAYFNNQFTTLVSAVQAADPSVLELLLSNGPSGSGLTLFAPTNDAFAAAGITDVNGADAILAYHVIDGTVMAADLPVTTGASAEIDAIGGNFYLSNTAGKVSINGTTTVTKTDIMGSNGVVHVIDRTLVPPTQTITEIVVGFTTAMPAEFTLLAAALGRADLVEFFNNADDAYTVFAPTDTAFINAGFTTEAAINAAPVEAVTAVLTHHVVGDAYVFSTDLVDGSFVEMLNNQSIFINTGDLTVQDASGSTPAAKLTPNLLNVHATNGVVHVIDAVLIPQS